MVGQKGKMVSRDTGEYSKERLALLYQISQTFSSSLELEEVLNLVIDEVISITSAERGFVMLREEDGALVFRAARGIDHATINQPQFEISHSVVEQVINTGETLLTSDAQQDEILKNKPSVASLKLHSILCVPLKIKGKLLGAVYVDNRVTVGIFSEADLDLLSAIASSAAIAIENARLYQAAVDKGRMERELQVASRVQSSLIPDTAPEMPDWEISAHWVPARVVSGDFYDFIQTEDGQLGLVIADVVDKGIGAALFMAFSRSVLRATLSRISSPKEGVAEANRLICKDSAYGMFLTLVYVQINPETNELEYVNAGHNPPLFYSAGEGQFSQLGRTGMLVGVEEDADYEQADLNLKKGDFIVFYTDGVIDALNQKWEDFGMERFQAAIPKKKNASAEDIKANIIRAIEDFTGTTPQYDDITLLVIRRV